MLERKDIEAILKINGVNASSPDDEIRSVLLSARYNNDEVDTALMVLRENRNTHQTRVDGLHKIFRSDSSLKPSEISALLGINVNLENVVLRRKRNSELSVIQSTVVTVFAIILALTVVVIAMYIYKVGIFHPSVSAFGY